MEYQVSARKYRPMTFSTVVGQEALTSTLKNAVASGKLAHAFLFCGPRGVGKTTCARIFAKTINCSNISPDGEACGECESCKAFAEGRSYNVFELDAASNNGVEHIKQLMEQTHIPPQVGRYKVFIIDEVHMLSTAAFNAFLKTLEEPPAYVIFILATTEKNKLLPTIISRCQIYDFDRMTVPATVNHLKMVAEREGYTYEEEALQIIAEKADGGMRDALSIFDQAASFCQGNITTEKVIRDLNLMDTDNYFRLTDLAVGNKVSDVMLLINDMIGNGMEGSTIVQGLAAHLRNVMVAKDQKTLPLLEVSERYRERFHQQAQSVPASFLFKALQILNRCDLNYRQSSNKRLLVELTMIEVAQVTQPDDADASAPRVGRRLKSLFKFIIPQQQNGAVQVAPAAKGQQDTSSSTAGREDNGKAAHVSPSQEAVQSASDGLDGTATDGTKSVTPVAPRSGRIKLKGSGTSFSSLLNDAKKKEEVMAEEVTVTSDEDSTFDNDKLQLEWLSMCMRMAQNRALLGLASSMKNIQPVITDYPNVAASVANSILLEQIKGIRARIEATLIQRLHNGNIKFSVRLAEGSEIKPMLTKGEIFVKLKEENIGVASLIKALNLELV